MCITYSDRKSTRLNSSHLRISYAVFCLKKKRRSGDRRGLSAAAANRPAITGEHLSETGCLARCLFFLNDPATTEIYTLPLHDALPISTRRRWPARPRAAAVRRRPRSSRPAPTDRKSTRLNSSHLYISYAVFCLKQNFNTYVPRMLPNHGRGVSNVIVQALLGRDISLFFFSGRAPPEFYLFPLTEAFVR